MKANSDNIFLVGMMGAGKSTVGKTLAHRLGKVFVDSDHEIEARTGVTISVIFELEGEAGFRKREADTIEELTLRSNLVLATGGGAIQVEETRMHLRNRGFTIYISSTVPELWQRTRHDRNRPMLKTQDPRARLQELLSLREPLYQEVADMVIETGRPSVGKMVGKIIDGLTARPECSSLLMSMLNLLPETENFDHDA